MSYLTHQIRAVLKRALSSTIFLATTVQLLVPTVFAAGTDTSTPKDLLTQGANVVTEYVNQEDGQTKTIYWTQGVTPPKMGGENSDFRRIPKDLLTQGANVVTEYVNQEDGQTKTIYWTQGVTPPKMGGENSDFRRIETSVGSEMYVEYIAPFVAGNGWFDTNKSISLEYDANLCFSAAATNTLHWWLNQNENYIEQYLQKDPVQAERLKPLLVHDQGQSGSPIYKIFVDQHWWLNQNENYIEQYLQKDPVQAERLKPLLVHDQGQSGSPIYKIFVDQFAMRQEGYWPDILQDQFLNGYRPKANGGVNDEEWDGPQLIEQGPDKRGGFFYDVLKAKRLTRRSYYDAGPKANGGVNDEEWDGPQLIEQGPDKRGGFFYDVLKAKRLTRRSYYDAGYDALNRDLKEHLQNGEIALLSYSMGPAKSHVVTIWGVEYDQNGRLSAVYISDSDDEPNPTHGMMRYGIYRNKRGQAILSNRTDGSGTTIVESLQFLSLGDKQWKQSTHGMMRYGIYRNKRGQAILSNRTDGSGTTIVESLQFLSLGDKQWKQFLGIEQKGLRLKWDKTEFTYDGTEHCPTIHADGIQVGDDVQLNVTGATSHAGTHTATVTLDGADAAKYEISGSNSIQYTILPASPTVQFTATVQDDTVNLCAVVSGLADDTLTGNVEFKKDGETICSSEASPTVQFTATVQDDTVNLCAVVSGLADDTLTGNVEFKKDGETICSSELNGNVASSTTVQDDTVNLCAVVSGLADDTLTGNVEFKKDGETICSSELNGNVASSMYSVSEPGTHVFAATYIPSENSNYSESTSAPQTVDVSKQDQSPLTIDSICRNIYSIRK